MTYAMEKSTESLSKSKWWRTIAVGSLALSLLVGSCSAKHQSPESAPETSTSASATPGGLTYEELASEIGNGKPVWIAPVAYPENADGWQRWYRCTPSCRNKRRPDMPAARRIAAGGQCASGILRSQGWPVDKGGCSISRGSHAVGQRRSKYSHLCAI